MKLMVVSNLVYCSASSVTLGFLSLWCRVVVWQEVLLVVKCVYCQLDVLLCWFTAAP